ncbi:MULTISPECIES: replication initiation protein [unclassified Acinetobacter]|uniref:replication initiation protein n=1 Tax=unclassified Acinetobacter TaxID=196816 RepID=UPI0015D1A4DF|nr:MULTISPECIES: RepB family plasmid replication initiator protein [unclassified Acinetobacter]
MSDSIIEVKPDKLERKVTVYKSSYKLDLVYEDVQTIRKNNFFINDLEALKVQNLTPDDFRIITTAFIMADYFNKQGYDYDANTEFSIGIKEFNALWRISRSTSSGYAYRSLFDACERLRSNSYQYLDLETGEPVKSGLFAYIKSEDAVVTFGFPKPLIAYLKRMDKYTWLWFESLVALAGKPIAGQLFEFICSKRYIGKKNISGDTVINVSIEKFREIFSDFTSTKADLIRRKITPAIESINSNTSLTVQSVPISEESCKITGYTLVSSFDGLDGTLKAVHDPTLNMKRLFSEKQVAKFTPKLLQLESFEKHFKQPKESVSEFYHRITVELTDNLRLLEFYPFLVQCGYTNKRIEKLIIKQQEEKAKKSKENPENSDELPF